MNRRSFFKITGTCTGGLLLLPDFLYSFALQDTVNSSDSCIIFLQLNGGNDGLNTFVPYQNDLYYKYRPAIALSKKEVITSTESMAFHPALKGLAEIQQKGHLTILQNVGYPEPNRSHFRSREIWQTASDSQTYLREGWIGRFLDKHYQEHHPTAAINVDSIDNLALKGSEPNTITVKNPKMFEGLSDGGETKLSGNPQLDFVRKIAGSITDGADLIQKALATSKASGNYPTTPLAKNLQWISRLIKGNLNSNVYYTSIDGFDTHQNQLKTHANRLTEVNDALYAFYNDMAAAKKLEEVTIVIFSEFGRRVADNGRGTDHGTAAPVFIIGGKNRAQILGNNPNLSKLDNGDLIHEIDFRSVYASLLKNKFNFDPTRIGIKNAPLQGIF